MNLIQKVNKYLIYLKILFKIIKIRENKKFSFSPTIKTWRSVLKNTRWFLFPLICTSIILRKIGPGIGSQDIFRAIQDISQAQDSDGGKLK